MDLEHYIQMAKVAAKAAGEVVLDIFNEGSFTSELKADNSPLSRADKEAHAVISRLLLLSGLPLLSEEGSDIDFEIRKSWPLYWLVDPVDGTREFLDGSPDFTINIALIKENYPVAGVIYVPMTASLYWGSLEGGAWKTAGSNAVSALSIKPTPTVEAIVMSRHHSGGETPVFLNRYPKAEKVSRGSSLKFMLLAEGEAQLYPRFAPTMEWDTAAAQAILEAAGGTVQVYPDGGRLRYNKKSLVNDWFLAASNQDFVDRF